MQRFRPELTALFCHMRIRKLFHRPTYLRTCRVPSSIDPPSENLEDAETRVLPRDFITEYHISDYVRSSNCYTPLESNKYGKKAQKTTRVHIDYAQAPGSWRKLSRNDLLTSTYSSSRLDLMHWQRPSPCKPCDSDGGLRSIWVIIHGTDSKERCLPWLEELALSSSDFPSSWTIHVSSSLFNPGLNAARIKLTIDWHQQKPKILTHTFVE